MPTKSGPLITFLHGTLHYFEVFVRKEISKTLYLVDIGKFHPRIGRHAVGGDLPQQDPEGPNVGLGGELVVGEALWRCPLDRELGAGLGGVGVLSY